MAFIDKLRRHNWQSFLRLMFAYTVEQMESDHPRPDPGSVAELKQWLTHGGVSGLKLSLEEQMQTHQFSDERQAAVQHLIDELAQEYRNPLLNLMVLGRIPLAKAELLLVCGWSEAEFEQLWQAQFAQRSSTNRM